MKSLRAICPSSTNSTLDAVSTSQVLFGDDKRMRGISIYDSTSVDEVASWVRDDPAVKSGWMTAEIRPWWGVGGAALPT
jgi:hypothetical protein